MPPPGMNMGGSAFQQQHDGYDTNALSPVAMHGAFSRTGGSNVAFDMDGPAHATAGYEFDHNGATAANFHTPGTSSGPAGPSRFRTEHNNEDEYITITVGQWGNMSSQVDSLANQVASQTVLIQELRQQVHHRDQQIASLTNKIPELEQRIGDVHDQHNADLAQHVREALVAQAPSVIVAHTTDMISGLQNTMSELKAQVLQLEERVLSTAAAAHATPRSSPHNHTDASGFRVKGGVAYDIVNLPAAVSYDQARQAIADLFGLEDLPHGNDVAGAFKCVARDDAKNFSVWSFKLYTADYDRIMEDRPSVVVQVGEEQQRTAYINLALTHAERSRRRTRKVLADQIKQQNTNYFIRWHRDMPFAVDRATRSSYKIRFNATDTEAVLNGVTYNVGAAGQAAARPNGH